MPLTALLCIIHSYIMKWNHCFSYFVYPFNKNVPANYTCIRGSSFISRHISWKAGSVCYAMTDCQFCELTRLVKYNDLLPNFKTLNDIFVSLLNLFLPAYMCNTHYLLTCKDVYWKLTDVTTSRPSLWHTVGSLSKITLPAFEIQVVNPYCVFCIRDGLRAWVFSYIFTEWDNGLTSLYQSSHHRKTFPEHIKHFIVSNVSYYD